MSTNKSQDCISEIPFLVKKLTNLTQDIFPGILQPTLTSLRCAVSLLTALEIARQTSALGDGVSIPGMVGYYDNMCFI